MEVSQNVSIKNSIATRVLMVVLGLYLVIAITVGTAQLYVAYCSHNANVGHELKGIENSFSGPLALSLWNLDENTLRASIQGIINMPLIERMTVINEYGRIVANGLSVREGMDAERSVVHINMAGFSDEEEKTFNHKHPDSEQIEYKIPLVNTAGGKNEKIGEATFYFSSHAVSTRVKAEGITIAVIIGVSLLVFALALFWAVNRYLRRPLAILTNATAGISLDNLDEFTVDTKTVQPNEIKQLEETLCSMVKDLHQAVSEKEKLQSQLVQSQKMEAIGQLAGGVAHDFNNMLAGIMGCAELIETHASSDPEIKELTGMIMSAAERSADLSNKLKAFGRKQKGASTAVDIHSIIHDTVAILENTMDKRIAISVELNAEKTAVIGDPAQLQSVFLNLGINACHAMPEGGSLTYSSDQITFDQAYCDLSPFDLHPGVFIHIAVRDTGSGIAPEIIDKIFEPFFTTKEQGKGTGLGLAASYGTIQQHHGVIEVNSELGDGTCFHLYLPVTGDEVLKQAEEEVAVTGEGCILVVDDEQIIRATVTAFLKDFGYKVMSAEDGLEAVTCYREHADEIDLVLSDMIMPRMSGRDCFRELKTINPEVRFILASGFTREEDTLEMEGLSGFITKPYRRSQLSRIVAEVLDS